MQLIADPKLPFDGKIIEQEAARGKTAIIVATAHEVMAVVMIADAIKPEAVSAIHNLHALGIKLIMLTGDTKNTAEYIAKLVGIDEVMAEVLPEDKLKKIQALQSQGHIVAMA